MTDEPNEKVGYRNPPVSSRFKPGQSGNPNGRRVGSKNFATDLADALSEEILVRKNGADNRTTKQRAVIDAIVTAATHGDMRAIATLMSYCLRPTSRTDNLIPEVTNREDSEILKAVKLRKNKNPTQKILPSEKENQNG